jgi:hypothetical protein
VNRRSSSGLSLGSAFTYSRAMDSLPQQTGFTPTTVQDAYNPAADYSRSSVDRTLVFSVNAQYQLPFARNAKSLFYRDTVGGWTVSSVFYAASGAPVSLVVTPDIAGVGTAGSRASLVPGVPLKLDHPTAAKWFNTAAVVPANQMTAGQFGNSSRNVLVGPGTAQLDLALFKYFSFGEATRLEFRAESFNLPNHASFTAVATTVGASNFGAVTATTNPRIIQFAAKYIF